MGLDVWIPTFGLPIVGLLLNIGARLYKKLPQSALPDFILTFALIDLLIAMDSHHFEKFIQITWVKAAVPHVYGIYAVVVVVLWAVVSLDLEHRMAQLYIKQRNAGQQGPNLTFSGMRILLASLVMASVVVFACFIPFAYRG